MVDTNNITKCSSSCLVLKDRGERWGKSFWKSRYRSVKNLDVVNQSLSDFVNDDEIKI